MRCAHSALFTTDSSNSGTALTNFTCMRTGISLLDMTQRDTMPRTIALTALASLSFALLPSAAFAAPSDGSSVPVARGEAPARSCYLRAQQQWNHTMADSPRNRRQLDS